MDKERIGKYVSDHTIKVIDAMEMIDNNSAGLIFIVDAQGKLEGCLTDGDIRRWILKGGDLQTKVETMMSKVPLSLNERDSSRAMEYLKEKCITALPITDDAGCIVDIVFLHEWKAIKKSELLSNVSAVVMAGGRGTRLYPYTKILPKPLIPIGDTPIVERVIKRLSEYGIGKIYLTINYKGGMIKSYFNEAEATYNITYVEENKPLGTAGSIKLIKDDISRPLIVTNCDSLILTDYTSLYEHHLKYGYAITMVTALKKNVIPYGVITFGENGEIVSLEEKPTQSYFINTGMYVVNPEVVKLIPNDTMFHMTHLVEEVMKRGGKVGSYPISEDSFLDMGEFDEMKRMEDKLHVSTD